MVKKTMSSSVMEKIRDLLSLTKPLQTFLLMVTMYGAYLAAGGSDLRTAILLSISGFAGIGGTTMLNMLLERDIDSVMERTASRPLPSKRLTVPETSLVAITLIVIGIISGYAINPYVAMTVFLGTYFDVIIYTNIVKRRTPANIVLGGVAGGMPALGGWSAAVGGFTFPGILLAFAVMLWIPLHIWILAYYLKNQYIKAQIPQFPILAGPQVTSAMIRASLILLVADVFLFTITQGYGILSLVSTTILVARVFRKLIIFSQNPDSSLAFKIYKMAGPVIGALFIFLPIDYHLQELESSILTFLR
ncbi:MAG: heme o synthase [Desulfurococcales archaeon]|nr:heme o synthase [Desulfurococcales archaeon]